MISIEKIEDSFELPIGTRFYFMGHIYEVVKSDDGRSGCPKCALFDEHEICGVMNCDKRYRHDKKINFFKEVEEVEEDNNGRLHI